MMMMMMEAIMDDHHHREKKNDSKTIIIWRVIRLHTSIWRMFFFGAHLLHSLKIRQGFHFLDPKIFKIKKISAHYWGLVLQHRQTKPGRKTNVEISISFVFCFSLVKKHFFFL